MGPIKIDESFFTFMLVFMWIGIIAVGSGVIWGAVALFSHLQWVN